MATVDSLLPKILVYAYNAPINLVRQAIVDSSREFCRNSMYWREDLTAEDTVVDQSVYPLTLPADSEVVDFNDIYFSTKRRLIPKTMRQLDAINEQWRTQTGEPYYYLREANASVKLVYIPQEVEVGAIQANAVLQPTSTATTIDDKILANYDEAIIYGALYRVMRVPGKAWSDMATATYYEGLFREKVEEATSRGTDERTKGVIRTVKYGGL